MLEKADSKRTIAEDLAELTDDIHRNTAFLLFTPGRDYPDKIIEPKNALDSAAVRKGIETWNENSFGSTLYKSGIEFQKNGTNYHVIAHRQTSGEKTYELVLVSNIDRTITAEYSLSAIALGGMILLLCAAIFPSLLSLTLSVKRTRESIRRDDIEPNWFWTKEVFDQWQAIKTYKIDASLNKIQIDQSTSGQMIIRSRGIDQAIIHRPNQALANISGYPLHELDGQPLNKIVPKEFHAYHFGLGVFDNEKKRRVGMSAYAGGCPFHGTQASSIVGRDRTVDLLHKGGTIRKVALGVFYVGRNEGGIDEWAGVVTDVTDLTNAIAVAEESTKKEKAMREEFEALQQTWRHDLLSAVLGAHNMFGILANMGFKVEEPQFKEAYEIARAKAAFAYKLVRDTRDLGVSLDDLEKEPMTLRSLIDSIKILYTEANISYSITDEEKLVSINESSFVGRAISNLINNAIKFSGLNGIIEVGIRTKEESAIIYVKDNGVGIDEEGQKKIFSGIGTGVRLNQEIPGDGFGLNSANKIISAHNGSLAVKSQLGQGSIFFIKIPLLP